MIMCVLLCYPVSIHMSQLLSTGCPISSLIIHFKAFNDSSLVFSHCFYFFFICSNLLYVLKNYLGSN